ncbi:hypothetical protein HZB02_00430 [Candidatus Woesearchaeota archaeon]|nr:hypothetical protein [Candidatus Woesearchaeota archaeon]
MTKAAAIVAILCFLVIVPSVLADIKLSSSLNDVYNLGDMIILTGQFTADQPVKGTFLITTWCDNTSFPWFRQHVDLAGQETDLFTAPITLTSNPNIPGSCFFRMSVEPDTAAVAHLDSPSFLLTNALVVITEAFPPTIQKGDDFSIKGTVTRQDGTPIDGTIELTLFHNTTQFLTRTFPVTRGQFTMPIDSTFLEPGSYDVDLVAYDARGNRENIHDADAFTVNDRLQITLEAVPQVMEPLQGTSIRGTVVTELRHLNINGILTLTMGAHQEQYSVHDGSFSGTWSLPITTPAGNFTIQFIAEDERGNKGEENRTIQVIQLPLRLTVVASPSSVLPAGQVSLLPVLLDQTEQQISSPVTITLTDSKGITLANISAINGKALNFTIPHFEPPGMITVTASFQTLQDVKTVEILPRERLQISAAPEGLVAVNDGNIALHKTLQLTITNEQYWNSFDVQLNILPNTSFVMPLSSYAAAGIYTVSIPSLNLTFANISIGDQRSSWRRSIDRTAAITGKVVGIDTHSPKRQYVETFLAVLVILAISILGTLIIAYITKPEVNIVEPPETIKEP